MKNKMKKLAAMMLVAVALCGSVLTTQAAVYRGCGHPSTIREVTQNTVLLYTHQYTKNSITYTCNITRTDTTVTMKCVSCGVILSQVTTPGAVQHSQSH